MMATCVLHILLLSYLPPRLGREPEESASFNSVLRALCTRLGRGAAARVPSRPPTAAPPPSPCSGSAGRFLHPPRVPRRKRAAADLPRWHRSHKPTRNCKANKAEILGLVSVVTRSTLLPPICLCSSI